MRGAKQDSSPVAILGAGSWGTTLAIHLARKGFEVGLWDISREQIEEIGRRRENVKVLPSFPLPPLVKPTPELMEATSGAKVVVLAIPSHGVREVVGRLKELDANTMILSAAKGIEEGTLMRMSEVISEVLPGRRVIVLSGPSHAEEVVREIPTTVVVSSKEEQISKYIQDLFMTESFRLYTNPDMVGVELGGALKNTIAIAAGISDGLGFGSNSKAALLTRGLAEICRLGVAMGANPHTFSGLSGMGDLITTCISGYSRNRGLGERIAQGRSLEEALRDIGQVAEGVRTTRAAYELAKRYKVEVPITNEIYGILFKGESPKEAVKRLMLREAKAEVLRP